MPLLVLALVSLAVGAAGAYVLSRNPFRTLAAKGVNLISVKALTRRDVIKAWLAARRHPATAEGLALLAALLVFIVGWLVVGVFALLVREQVSALADVDSTVARWGHDSSSALSQQVSHIVTFLGDTRIIAGLALLLALFIWTRRRNRYLIAFLLAVVAGDAVMTYATKEVIDRARPAINPIAHSLGPSFPSGHSSMAAAFFAAAALLLTQGRSRAVAAVLGGTAVMLTVAVATSRVLLDVHWLSDVIAGMAFGWAWFAFCVLAFDGSLGTGAAAAVPAGRPMPKQTAEPQATPVAFEGTSCS